LKPPRDGEFFPKQTPRERFHHYSFVRMKEREKAESEGRRKIGWVGEVVMPWGSGTMMEAWEQRRLGVREAAKNMWEREKNEMMWGWFNFNISVGRVGWIPDEKRVIHYPLETRKNIKMKSVSIRIRVRGRAVRWSGWTDLSCGSGFTNSCTLLVELQNS
jgi:hypothetical protein